MVHVVNFNLSFFFERAVGSSVIVEKSQLAERLGREGGPRGDKERRGEKRIPVVGRLKLENGIKEDSLNRGVGGLIIVTLGKTI